jgi:hypothetical protein
MSQTIIRDNGTPYPVQLLMTKNGNGIGGQTPTIEVRKMSDGKYLDFSAVMPPYFVSTGGQQTEVMTPAPWLSSLYQYMFVPANVGITGIEQFTFVVRNVGVYPVLETECVIYDTISPTIEQILTIVEKILKTKVNRLKIDKVANTLTYYDDDQITPLYVFDLFDVNGLPNWKNILERVPQ